MEVTASGSDGNLPEGTLDGLLSTRWSAQTVDPDNPHSAAVWCSIYAAAHVWWAVAGDPGFFAGGSPDGCEQMCGESPLPGGWLPVVLAGAAAVGALALALPGTRRAPWVRRWPWVGLAGLAVSVTLVEVRRLQRPSPGRSAITPWWGFAGGYLVLAGTGARTLPYLPSLFDIWSRESSGFRLFVVLLITSGTVLPMAMVHRWGRIWPRWTGPLAGRDVPRWLVLGPGPFMGAGLVAYFGVGRFGAILTGVEPAVLPLVLQMGGYTAGGLGLLVASVSYARLTSGSGGRSACTLRAMPVRPALFVGFALLAVPGGFLLHDRAGIVGISAAVAACSVVAVIASWPMGRRQLHRVALVAGALSIAITLAVLVGGIEIYDAGINLGLVEMIALYVLLAAVARWTTPLRSAVVSGGVLWLACVPWVLRLIQYSPPGDSAFDPPLARGHVHRAWPSGRVRVLPNIGGDRWRRATLPRPSPTRTDRRRAPRAGSARDHRDPALQRPAQDATSMPTRTVLT